MRLKLLLCLMAAPACAQEFTPVQIAPHVYEGGWEHFVGGGLAAFDCNGDNRPELYAAGGTAPSKLFRNISETDVAFTAQTPDALSLTGVAGAYPIDFDSDGITDLAILRVGANMLMRGGPDCTFERYDMVFDDHWTTAFSATWEDGQDWPTLAFGNYVNREDPNGPFEACATHELYRPQANGYGAPITLTPGYCALSMLFSDWSRNGRQDLRISNDRHYYVRGGQEQLWAMETEPRLYTLAEGWIKHELWGMGIASRDMNGDGLPDVYLTSMGDQRFQLRDGEGPRFTDAAHENGITAHRPYTGGDGRPSTGWHAVFGDVQNDGLDDLFVSKGNVEQMPSSAFDDPNNLLIQTANGFVERGDAAGVATLARSRGAVLSDFNLDGLLDLAIINRRAPMELYQNTTPDTGRYLGVSLSQTAPNTNAVGAWIELRAGTRVIAREVTIGGGHAGGTLGPEHFGLGDRTQVEMRIIWPDQSTSDWVQVETNRYITAQRDGDDLLIDF